MEPDSLDHVPVLAERVIELLHLPVGGVAVDATAGLAGHAALMARELGPTGHLIVVDQDPESLEIARRRLAAVPSQPRLDVVHGNFADLEVILSSLGVPGVDGFLADLGVSSPQLDKPERGFSFRSDGPLDMRMDPTRGDPASKWIERLSQDRLAKIFWEFGEERYSRRVAAKIAETRSREPIRTTGQLAALVRACIPYREQRGRKQIDPATRVFQALRIAVNDELGALDALLSQLPRCVRPGGRAAIISFHSLEDRRVKEAFRDRERWEILTKKPHQATEEEIQSNPRARSAKLRAARRTAETRRNA